MKIWSILKISKGNSVPGNWSNELQCSCMCGEQIMPISSIQLFRKLHDDLVHTLTLRVKKSSPIISDGLDIFSSRLQIP